MKRAEMLCMPRIESAAESDRSRILFLLGAAGLPIEDLATAPVEFWVARSNSDIAGAIGVERYGTSGLLRSLVVDARFRNAGIGAALIHELERAAQSAGIGTLALLTQTAQAFFAQRGYVTTRREDVSEAIRQSEEFKSLCSASAACMTKALKPSSN